jgi:hypothetical protein
MRKLLALLGICSMLAGLAAILIAVFFVKPRADRLVEEVRNNFRGTRATLLTSEKHAPLIPLMMKSIGDSVYQSANLLEAGSRSLEALSQGASGIVLPDNELRLSADEAGRVATELRETGSVVRAWSRASEEMSKPSSGLPTQPERLRQLEVSLQRMQLAWLLAAIPASLGLGLLVLGALAVWTARNREEVVTRARSNQNYAA